MYITFDSTLYIYTLHHFIGFNGLAIDSFLFDISFLKERRSNSISDLAKYNWSLLFGGEIGKITAKFALAPRAIFLPNKQ